MKNYLKDEKRDHFVRPRIFRTWAKWLTGIESLGRSIWHLLHIVSLCTPDEGDWYHTSRNLYYTCRRSIAYAPRHTLNRVDIHASRSESVVAAAFSSFMLPLFVRASKVSPYDHLLILSFRASTPLSTASSLPTFPLLTLPFRRRRPHKSKVDSDSLIQQLGIICTLDRGFGFFLGRIFNENVTLVVENISFTLSLLSTPASRLHSSRLDSWELWKVRGIEASMVPWRIPSSDLSSCAGSWSLRTPRTAPAGPPR